MSGPASPPSGLSASVVGPNQINLAWTNGGGGLDYDLIEVERNDGGGWDRIAELAGHPTSYVDSSVADGSAYNYRVRAYGGTPPDYTSYSNESGSVTTYLWDPSEFTGSALSDTSIKILWRDNSTTETGFEVYRDGAYLATAAAGAVEYTDIGLTPGVSYRYKVRAVNALTASGFTPEISITTDDPPAAPSDLTATAVGTTSIRLNWVDNADNETGFKVYESTDGISFSKIADLGVDIRTYLRTGLISNTQYWYRVYATNSSGDSAASNTANAQTFAAISTPTNLAAVAYGSGQVEITFQDNSELEDDHRLERKTGAGAFAEVATIEPNRTFYRNSGLAAGTTYVYRVRAKQGGSYSGYSNEVTVTTLAVPSAATGLAISSVQSTRMRLTWTRSASVDEVGYIIERSTGGAYTEIVRVHAGVTSFLATGLSPSTMYYFKVTAFNAVGSAAAAGPVNDTTLAAYVRTKMEILFRDPRARLTYLVEINPKFTLAGFSLTATKTYTYEVSVGERGVNVTQVYENGVAYVEEDAAADVESVAGTFYFDYYARKLYVHTFSGASPAGFTMEAGFWLYYTNRQSKDSHVSFNGNNYLGLFRAEDLPDVTSEIKRLYEGTWAGSSGSVSLINAKIGGAWYWDARFDRYTFENRQLRILVGGAGFAYSDYYLLATYLISDRTCNDQQISFELRDLRDNLDRQIPERVYSTTEYPRLDANAKGKYIPVAYGTIANYVPACIDTTDRKYKLSDYRIKSVTSVLKNGSSTLVAGTDYFVDYQRGVIELARSVTMGNEDYLLCSFTGRPKDDDTLISTVADIFVSFMTTHPGLAISELDLDTIYDTRIARTAALGVLLTRQSSVGEVIRTLELSGRAYTDQNAEGRIGLRVAPTSAAEDAVLIGEHQIFDISAAKKQADIFETAAVYYSEDYQQEDRWEIAAVVRSAIGHRSRIHVRLRVNTYLTTETDALALATDLAAQSGAQVFSAILPLVMFGVRAGDIFKLTRSRFFNSTGAANETIVRALAVAKSPASRRAAVVFEVVE
jgi:hypothetical protein